MTTRSEFLDRIRTEMRKTPGLFPATVARRPARPAAEAEIVRRELAERWPETLGRFRLEFERVGGILHRAATVRDVPAIIGTLARERGARSVVTWPAITLGGDLVGDLGGLGLDVLVMPEAEVAGPERARLRAPIAEAAVGVTGVDLAIAETGTLVLRSGSGRPRSTSLLSPYHVALFDRGALVESLAQLGIFLEAWHAGPDGAGLGAMINFITGPSRTADIELTLTRGVHGPAEVHAVFVEAGLGG
jgi:L-lactate dehydrogenase complex protein LldG